MSTNSDAINNRTERVLIADAIEDLKTEVRLARADFARFRSDALEIASRFAGPVAPIAQSERIQYPFCEACNSYHHPDYYLCVKLQPKLSGEELEAKLKANIAQLCTCGHNLGAHAAAGFHCCAYVDVGTKCPCEKFQEPNS